MEICNKCPLQLNGVCSKSKTGIAIKSFEYNGENRYKGKTYTGCGCLLKAKTSNSDSKCPIGKW